MTTKSSAELELEVEDARGRIDRTVEALKDKMQPRELFDEATRMMGGASNKVLTTAVDQLRENPVPMALIGLGVAWMAISQARRGGASATYGSYASYEGYDDGDAGLKDKVRSKVTAAKAKVSAATETAKDKLSSARSSAGESLDEARGRVSGLAQTAQMRAGEYSRMARDKFDDTLETEPLVIGAIGLAVGAAIGAALPASDMERRYMGPARSKAAEKAKASLGEVKDVAQRAYGQVKDELHRQTGPEGEGTTLADKAAAVAQAGARTVKDEVEGRAH